jgi:hypothetical protein
MFVSTFFLTFPFPKTLGDEHILAVCVKMANVLFLNTVSISLAPWIDFVTYLHTKDIEGKVYQYQPSA